MKRSIIWVVFHCLVVAFTLISLATGFRIAILDKPELLWFDPVLPQGNLHYLHIASGFAIAAIVGIYLLALIPALRLKPLVKVANKAALFHRVVQWLGYLVFPFALVTGFALFYDYSALIARWDLHFYAASIIFVYVFLHGGGYFIHYGMPIFKRILLPGSARVRLQLLVLLAVSVFGLSTWWFMGRNPAVPVQVAKIDMSTLVDIDGEAKEAIWQHAPKYTIQTHGGANFDNGSTVVTVQAVHNGIEAYFLFVWNDPTKSLAHLPLLKTQQGWQVQHNGFYQFDEIEFYEDKFAVMLSNVCESAAAGTAHLGRKPLAGMPANWHGKGYHYVTSGSSRDIWHWKAVRTNDMYLADDNVFTRPQLAKPGERRYYAGYMPDGKESGAYVMNWQWFKPGVVVPRRIPKQASMIDAYQNQPSTELSWVISWFDYEPYHAEKDHYPVGTVMPSVLYRSNRFEGDRADVRARGEWKNGQWFLEVSRRLNTASTNDVVLADGVCMWVSAFDRSQVAHTRHHQAMKLQFEALQ